MVSESFGLEAERRTVAVVNTNSWPQSALSVLETPGNEDATGTTASAAMQVMLTCLGIAALTMPHLFAQVGWGLGILILAVPASISCLSMRQIVLLAEASGEKGMAGAFSPHLGGKIGIILSTILFLLCELIVAASLAIPCDILPKLSTEIEWLPELSREAVGVFIVLGAGIAGLAKDLSALDRVLKPSISLFIYLMLYVVLRSCVHGTSNDMEIIVWEASGSSLTTRVMHSFSTAAAAFGAEAAISAIYANTAPQFRKPISSFATKVIDFPMLLLLVIYVVFGFAGYSEYGEGVESNLLKTMGNEWSSQVAKIGLSFVNIFRVPLFNVVQWYTVLDIVPSFGKLEVIGFGFGRCLVLSCMNLASLGIYLFSSDLGKVLGFLGGGFAIPVCTLLPGAAWLAARYCSDHRLLGSYQAMDVFSVIVLIPMLAFYIFNMVSFFQ